MVLLTLIPSRGNGGGRVWPHSGFLGLTKITVDGTVRTRLDDDQRPLQASSITISVRCYESRLRLGSARTNTLLDATQTLWSKPDDVQWSDIGDLDLPFKITLPAKTAGFSTANFQDYRVFWRVEATLNHIPMTGLGSRQVRYFDLNLVRHDVAIPTSIGPAFQSHSETGTPRIQYRMVTPSYAVGPSDHISVSVRFQPVDRMTIIQAMCVIIERRIQLRETSASPPAECIYTDDSPPATARSTSGIPAFSTSSITLLANTNASTSSVNLSKSGRVERKRSQSPSNNTLMPSRTVTHNVASTEVDNVTADSDGTYYHTFGLTLPQPKSAGHWSLGETMRTDLATLRFFVRVKIIVQAGFGMTESVELDERELFVVATSEEDRRLALQKISDRPSKSPTGTSPLPLPVPPVPPIPSNLTPPSNTKKPRASPSPRRPQTANGSSGSPSRSSRGVDATQPPRPHSATDATISTGAPPVPQLETSLEQIKAWEEELERIARRSRRKSVIMPRRTRQRRDDDKSRAASPMPLALTAKT